MNYKQIKTCEKIRKLSGGFQFELLIKAIVFSNPYEKILLIDVSRKSQNVIPFVHDARIIIRLKCARLVASC